MDKRVTMLALLAMLCFLSIAAPQHEGRANLQPVIEGSEHPELIPDRNVYSLLLRLIAHLDEESARLFIAQKGLGGQPEEILRLAREFAREVRHLDAAAARIKDENWPRFADSTMQELLRLQSLKNDLVDRVAFELPLEFRARALELKDKFRVSPSEGKRPSPNGSGR